MIEIYKSQVSTLLDILPFALKDTRLALKGGTAINLFHQDMPRLSVDIDLCYLDIENRQTTFKNLHSILSRIKIDLESHLNAKVIATHALDGKKESKLIVKINGIDIKIEPNYTLRGSLFDPRYLEISEATKKEFNKSAKVKCLSVADAYGGKLCAALDRQHPRDLFDVKLLIEKIGITQDIKNSFLFYLISHNRPLNELLNPNKKDITNEYENEFTDMTLKNIDLEDLLIIRESLPEKIINCFSEEDRNFLLSFVQNQPEWNFFKFSKVKDYPSVLWKLHNQRLLEKNNSKKFKQYTSLVSEIIMK